MKGRGLGAGGWRDERGGARPVRPRPASCPLFITFLAAWISLGASAYAQDPVVTKEAAPLPTEIAAPVRTALQAEGAVVMRADNRLEFWWVKSLPLDTAPAAQPSWSNVPEGALVGALRIEKALTDIRGAAVKPGVYTLRFAQQPQNGDQHGRVAGTASSCSSRLPPTTRPQTRPGTRARLPSGKKTLGKSHPSALALDPPTTVEPAGTVTTNDDGHKGVVFTVPVTLQGKAAGALSFGVTLVGQYEH